MASGLFKPVFSLEDLKRDLDIYLVEIDGKLRQFEADGGRGADKWNASYKAAVNLKLQLSHPDLENNDVQKILSRWRSAITVLNDPKLSKMVNQAMQHITSASPGQSESTAPTKKL